MLIIARTLAGERSVLFGTQGRIAIFSWATLIAGIAFGVFPRARPPAAALVSGALLVALALLCGLSVIWASDDGAALEEATRVAAYAGVFGLVVCVTERAEARPCG